MMILILIFQYFYPLLLMQFFFRMDFSLVCVVPPSVFHRGNQGKSGWNAESIKDNHWIMHLSLLAFNMKISFMTHLQFVEILAANAAALFFLSDKFTWRLFVNLIISFKMVNYIFFHTEYFFYLNYKISKSVFSITV